MFIVLVILLMMSAFFSASETALTSLSKIRLKNMVEDKIKNAALIEKLVNNPNKLLSAILVGNNLVNIAATSLLTSLTLAYAPKNGVAIATAITTIAVLIFGEITPKTFAAENSEKVSLAVAKIINAIIFVLTPVIWILNIITGVIMKILGVNKNGISATITEAELKTMVNVSHEEGVIEIDERRMINNVFDFDNSKAKDVMTPRTDMIAIEDTATYEEIVTLFKEERFSRLPVYHESIDNITGILHLKDIVFIDEKDFKVENYMREPYFTYESKIISELFSEMRTNRIPVAIILDEYGGTSGLVTIEDMVEEIVGEIADEYDEEDEEITVIKEDEYIVDGSTRLEDVNEMIGTKFESEDFDTIGGYVIGVMGRFPDEGEEIETDGIKIKVEKSDKNRIDELRIFT
ncbi:MAG TPA: HlyC/CorC family transporter [Candidatus Fimicola cottocaccae]|uniref:HlyC/CorC family transporter n=1 Tax=Tyzzerella sp. An114 TaxID=1965545 RepID=UPI000B4413AD|nr:hemolysin family protein [Tyzzerella sp. An114]HIT72621.1 HlyC/CorC family transporter [Candidatus Fimicola cottocaccae]